MITKRGYIMKNLNIALHAAIAFATGEVNRICGLEVLMGDYSPVDIDLADRWVGQVGDALHEGFVDWLLKHPEYGRGYNLLAVLRHGGQTVFVVDIPTDMAEIYSNMFRYEEERQKFTKDDFIQVPWLYMMEQAWFDKTMHLILPYEWEEFWDAYN